MMKCKICKQPAVIVIKWLEPKESPAFLCLSCLKDYIGALKTYYDVEEIKESDMSLDDQIEAISEILAWRK